MDTSKDQQELERLCGDGAPPWMDFSQHKPGLPGLSEIPILNSEKVGVKP
jgi:hypothetical protein